MREKLNKNLYRVLLISSFLALNALIILGISSVLGYLNTGADRSGMLQTGIKASQAYFPSITWDTLSYNGRRMEAHNLKQIERDYLNSWYVKNLSLKLNRDPGIEDYYTDSARVNIYRILDLNNKSNLSFQTTTLSHEPKLKFYSADGQLVVFEDRKVVEYSEAYKGDEFLVRSLDTSSYNVTMLLEDGFWRIRHKIRNSNSSAEKSSISAPSQWSIKNNKIFLENKEYVVKGINYYPRKTPWNMFGEDFNLEMLKKDFEIIKNAGLNTIRIFVNYEDFGKAFLKNDKVQKLKKTLDIAETSQLKVIVTLFDFYGDYSVMDWTRTHQHARQLVSLFRDHSAILAWDVKNEPDLDFSARGKDHVLNWIRYLIPQIKQADPNHLVSIGWSSPVVADLLQDQVDFVSFHYYGNPEDFTEAYAELKNQVSKPVVLGEFGMSSYDGFWNLFGKGEKGQAAYHEKMQSILQAKGPGFLSWTLYDFEEIPAGVVGPFPWRKARQKHFGFINASGRPKPSFMHISH